MVVVVRKQTSSRCLGWTVPCCRYWPLQLFVPSPARVFLQTRPAHHPVLHLPSITLRLLLLPARRPQNTLMAIPQIHWPSTTPTSGRHRTLGITRCLGIGHCGPNDFFPCGPGHRNPHAPDSRGLRHIRRPPFEATAPESVVELFVRATFGFAAQGLSRSFRTGVSLCGSLLVRLLIAYPRLR